MAQSGPAGRAALRVLVVDDQPDVAELLADFLAAEGHDVRLAYDGPEALRLAEEFVPEAVVLDIGMPRMDGHEVARRLRQHPSTQRALLIALSGYHDREHMERSRVAGFDHHLAKPIDLDALKVVVESPPPRRP